jgi:spore maturation protein CgeB
MHLVVFGLTVSSTWGNGHATLWRGLCRALSALGHRVTFFERDVPYYAAHRDVVDPDGCTLRLYEDWAAELPFARAAVRSADVAMITSYCPDAQSASDLVLGAPGALSVFYDMDTPVTLKQLERGGHVPYIPSSGLGGFDVVLSFTGGEALLRLQQMLGARRVAPLYGCVDPDVHQPAAGSRRPLAALSYLGTYADDRQDRLDRFFLEPARRRPDQRFHLAGSQYPADFPWTPNVFYFPHVAAGDHAAFFADARLTLNVTRGAMAELGYCPSPRLFEAAACGAAVLSDTWQGLDRFFEPGREILVAETTEEALDALAITDEEARRIASAARERALAQHTAHVRARELVDLLSTSAEDSTTRSVPVEV